MSTIFLSYAREDKWYVDDVYLALKKAGLSPWMDKPPSPYEREGIPPGSSWDDEIRNRLQTARVVLIFLSSVSIAKRGYVQKEFRLCLNEMMSRPHGSIYPIPVLIEPCAVPDVRVDTVRLTDFEWFELFSHGIDELVDYLKKIAPRNDKVTSAASIQTIAEYNRDVIWDVDLASVNGLLIIYMASLAKQKRVTIIIKELLDRLSLIDYLYAYGFLVALRTAKLIVFRSDFETYWAFDYVHPALTKDFKANFKRRTEQLLKDEGMSLGEFAHYEAEMRVIEDYIEEKVLVEKESRVTRKPSTSKKHLPKTQRMKKRVSKPSNSKKAVQKPKNNAVNTKSKVRKSTTKKAIKAK